MESIYRGFYPPLVDQIRKYSSLAKYTDQMSNSIKYTMLENAVDGISDLRTIKPQAAQFRAQMGTHLTYEQ